MITLGIKKLVENSALGFSTVGKNGEPHSIAVACVKVIGNKIIITNVHIKESLENIKNNPKVVLVVWNKEWEKACVGFEFRGSAKNYNSGRWFEFVKNMPDNKGYNVKSAIVITVLKIKKLSC